MANQINDFKQQLKENIHNHTLHADGWKSECWKDLIENITQDILDDAWSKHEIVQQLFETIGKIVPRKCKQLSRIIKKTDEVSKRGGEYFKVICDFVACRINCKVTDIPLKIDMIRDIVKSMNGVVYVRGESFEYPYGFCFRDGIYKDITQYVYVYIDDIGYPLEIQIGHEFASHTFTIDSALRDDPSCGLVDLWRCNFYDMVKVYILNKSNGITISDVSFYDIIETCNSMFNNNIPDNLRSILRNIQ